MSSVVARRSPLLVASSGDSFIDFLLTLVVTRVLKRNPRVKIVLMSAAMDSATITNFFAKALNGHVPKLMDLDRCRPHPLTIKYLDDFDFFTRKLASAQRQRRPRTATVASR